MWPMHLSMPSRRQVPRKRVIQTSPEGSDHCNIVWKNMTISWGAEAGASLVTYPCWACAGLFKRGKLWKHTHRQVQIWMK